MIAYIKGKLAGVYDEKIVVDAGGIGYLIFMSNASISLLPSKGEEIKIHTYLNVKEDAMQLFGFLTRDDLDMFQQIIGVSGIGPKGGMSILSVLSPDELRFAVVAGDIKGINAAPGIGKKTAEKLIIELRDKIKLEDALTFQEKEEASTDIIPDDITTQAVLALVSLGYGNTEALRAVRQVSPKEDDTIENILKQALKLLI